jgi:hypothetical protein
MKLAEQFGENTFDAGAPSFVPHAICRADIRDFWSLYSICY